jgi:hypothetical protein
MKSITRIVAMTACSSLVAVTAGPALAQYANEFSSAKVVKQGKTSHSIAGTGTVTVQVQVRANGSAKAIKVIRSNNSGDNAAAMDIANASQYRPAHRGNKPVDSFYDYVLKFNGKVVINDTDDTASGAMSGQAAAIDALIRKGDYTTAVSRANVALLSSPGNPQLLELLGTAQYYAKSYDSSAAAFARVPSVGKQFKPVAAQAFAQAAVSSTDAAQSLAYAQKAVALSNDANSQYALGVAQVTNKQYAQAIATLKPVLEKTTDKTAKISIMRELVQAYQGAGDTAGANAMSTQLAALDPQAAASAKITQLFASATQATNAKNYAEAFKDYDEAAQSATGPAAVTANTMAAFSLFRMDKPDWSKARDYAMKAVTLGPTDPYANYAAGVAWSGVYAGSHKNDDKQQALTYLNKADSLAKAAGNTGLSLQVENQIKQIPQ